MSTEQSQIKQFQIQNLIPFIVIFGIFYFLILRPQAKKQKDHKNFLDSLSIGDEVLMQSGIIGKITSIQDNDFVKAEISKDVEVLIKKEFIISKK